MATTTSLLIVTFLSLTFNADTLATSEKNPLAQEFAQSHGLSRIRRNHEIDFAPRLTHQAHSVQVQAQKPHAVECPVESKPESQVQWFKDGHLLSSEPEHLDQTGGELMFFRLGENDTGDYHCEASNYLGSVKSNRFRLQVQSTVHDARIRLEPKRAEVGQSRSAEFKCILPRDSTGLASNLISWRRDGRRLTQVVWLNSVHSSELSSNLNQPGKYLAKQVEQNEFVLTIARVDFEQDNNSTFSCVFDGNREDLGQMSAELEEASGDLALESDRAQLIVRAAPSDLPVEIDVNMAPPIDQLATNQPVNPNESGKSQPADQQNKRRQATLSEALNDLYEIAKPTLIIFGILSLVGTIVLLNFLVFKRPCCTSPHSANRYMKHHHSAFVQHQNGAISSSSSTGSSSGSSTTGGVASCVGGDPMLSSLLSRTLSAPSAASLVPGKKYKQYRDQMRKVAQAQTGDLEDFKQTGDFLDATNYFAPETAGAFFQAHHLQAPQLPDLYNQSLAARAQASGLLQASEHMRSLNNLMQPANANKHKTDNYNVQQSHLNLPMSFSFINNENNNNNRQQNALPQQLDANQLLSSSNHNNWQHQNLLTNTNSSENYQLVNCSSASPSSSSTSPNGGASPGGRNGHDSTTNPIAKHQPANSSVSHHYSTLDDDGDERYEELGEQVDQPRRASSSSSSRRSAQINAPIMFSQQNSSFRSINKTSTFQNSDICDGGLQTANRQHIASNKQTPATTNRPNYQDQLSPYAVSTICNNTQPPPPVTSEAIRALNEQFDINQLVLLDDPATNPANEANVHLSLPFEAPPPPSSMPPPPTGANKTKRRGFKKG